jgi:hypothetical protein
MKHQRLQLGLFSNIVFATFFILLFAIIYFFIIDAKSPPIKKEEKILEAVVGASSAPAPAPAPAPAETEPSPKPEPKTVPEQNCLLLSKDQCDSNKNCVYTDGTCSYSNLVVDMIVKSIDYYKTS